MAYLINTASNNKQYLLPHHSFGRRQEVVDTYINRPEVSKLHAVIEWNGMHWTIRDFSHNGTWLDEQKLSAIQPHELKQGQSIFFATQAEAGWTIANLSPPQNLLLPLNAQSTEVVLSNYNLLPNSQNPELALFYCAETGNWQTESLTEHFDEKNPTIKHDEQLVIKPFKWQLFLPNTIQPTHEIKTSPASFATFEFIFDVSLDEENIYLTLKHDDKTYDMGERTYHYTLLYLARNRIKDALSGLDNKNQGWVYNDMLAQDLGLDPSHLNIQIFRARKQFAEDLPHVTDINHLIERRRGSMRIGCQHEKIKIYKGEQLESIAELTS